MMAETPSRSALLADPERWQEVSPWTRDIIRDSKLEGKHRFCQHPESLMSRFDHKRCITPWRCIDIFGLDLTPSPTIHLPRMQQIDDTAGMIAPFFLLLGGLDSDQVLSMDEIKGLNIKPHKRLVFEAQRVGTIHDRRGVSVHTAVLIRKDREYRRITDYLEARSTPEGGVRPKSTLIQTYAEVEGELVMAYIAGRW